MYRKATPLLLAALFLFVSLTPASGVTDTFTAIADNTLYESVTGAVSNGSGDACFVGRTSNGDLRRAVLRFPLTTIPIDAEILDAELILQLVQEPPGAGSTPIDVHRVTEDWGESTSVGAPNPGQGGPAAVGDATWIHTFFNTSTWNTDGGDYIPAASASLTVDNPGSYTWGPTAALIADVQGWVDGSFGNFGWILIGDEINDQTARRFDTREALGGVVPQLRLTWIEEVFTDGFESGDTTAWSSVVN